MGNNFRLPLCSCPVSPAALPATAETSGSKYADLIVTAEKGGTILTMNDEMPMAQAVAVQQGKIAQMGEAADLLKLQGPSTQVVELTGSQTLMPGLIEPHTHPSIVTAMDQYNDISGYRCSSLEEIMKIMQNAVEEAETHPSEPHNWVTFFGWDPAMMPSLPALSAKWIDENVTPKYPVFILQQMQHSCWINTEGLRVCGITKDTPDPPGGKIVKDKDGNPTGMLKEVGGINLAISKIPHPSPLKLLEVLVETMKGYSREGFTTVTDLGTITFTPTTLLAMSFVSLLSDFPVRWGVYYPPTSEVKPSLHHFTKKLWFPGVKIWADGSPYAGSMACADDYLNTEMTHALDFDPKYPKGYLNYDNAPTIAAALRPFKDELLAIHAHGERAIDQALDAYEILVKEQDADSDHRYRLEHIGLITKEQLQRATKLGVTVTVFTDHIYYYGEALKTGILGEERANRFAPAGLISECGNTHWTIHQDSPCCPHKPLLAMKNAILRQTRNSGEVLGSEYCVSIEQALKAYTVNAAWQLKREDDIGSLAVGKFGDFVLLSDNPLKVKPETLPDIQVVCTYVGGNCFNC